MQCFSLPVLVSVCQSQIDDEAIERNTLSIRPACWFKKPLSFGDAHVVVVECAADSVIPKFLRVTLDTFWRARIDLCMHGLLQPQTPLQIYRGVFVYTSSRLVFEALDQRCDGYRGLPHAVLTSETVRHVIFPKQSVDLFVKTMIKSRIPLCAKEIRKRLTHLQDEELACPAQDVEPVETNQSMRLVMNQLMNKSSSKRRSNLSRTCMLLRSC